MAVGLYVYRQDGEAIAEEDRVCVQRFIDAFIAKKGVPPAGYWRVPGVGYCTFVKPPVHEANIPRAD